MEAALMLAPAPLAGRILEAGAQVLKTVRQLFAAKILAANPAQEGAKEAVNARAARILDTHGNAILRYAYSYLHNMEDAEEVLQDTLVQFLRTAPAFESESHEKAWLLRVAGNLSKNRLSYNAVRAADELNDELAACLAVLLVGAVALPRLISKPAPEESETMIANGMIELPSRDELSEAVGFPVKSASALPFFPQSILYTSYWGEMAQIDYANGGSSACFRQSLGEEDNSGDWNEYPAQEALSVSGCTVTLKGAPDSYTLAIWSDGTYSYSLSLSAGQPASVWEAVIEGVQ